MGNPLGKKKKYFQKNLCKTKCILILQKSNFHVKHVIQVHKKKMKRNIENKA